MYKDLYLDYLYNIKNILKDSDISLNKIEMYEKVIENYELIIPIIGSFSAGKSSLINSFLNENYLLVGITPETSIATELRYTDSNERIELVKENNILETYSINEIEKVKECAEKSSYVKIYLKNKNLKEISPIVLVDMPGFDSPLELHNQSILNYISKGSYYIILVNIEDGTLTRSMIRQIEGVKNSRKDFSFFLSKSNLRSNSEIEKVKEEIEFQIEDKLDLEKIVIPIYKNSGENLKIILKNINPEKLFKDLFFPEIKENYYEILENISLKETSLKSSIEENKAIIENLQKSIDKTLEKKEKMLDEVKNNNSENKINLLVNNVGKSLSNSIDELVNIAFNGNSELLSQTISDIVRNSLISETQAVISDIGNEIILDFKQSIMDLKYEDINVNIVDKISTTIANQLNGTNTWFKNINIPKISNKMLYRSVSTVLAVATSIVAPLLEIVIIFLPDIISALLKNSREKEQKAKIKNEFIGNIIPSLKMKLKEELKPLLKEETDKLIIEIGNRFENELKEKTEILNKTQEEKQKNIETVNKSLEKIKNIREDINLEFQKINN